MRGDFLSFVALYANKGRVIGYSHYMRWLISRARPFLRVITKWFQLPKTDWATILMYHSVSNRNDYFWSTSPEDFKKQMALLADNHIDVISLDELTRRLAAKELLRGAVVITFDDGYHDFYSDAFPFLQQYQFPSTMYLITGSIHTAKINVDLFTVDCDFTRAGFEPDLGD